MQNDENTEYLMNLSDEELVSRYSSNKIATSILISRYAKLICYKAQARKNFNIDSEDLMQEGLMGLLNAIISYDKEQGTKFSTYANVCITNKMITALIKNNKKEISMQISSSLVENEIELNLVTPESILIEKEKLQEIFKSISELLSEKEWKIFRLFLTGSTYEQMARQLNLPTKAVDNAMQRVRRKLKSVWRADNFSN